MDPKVWYLSKTVWGIILTAVGLILGFFNIEFTAEQQSIVKDSIYELITSVIQIIGVITIIVGSKKGEVPKATKEAADEIK